MRQELLLQMRRFCFILTRVQWKALLAMLADLQVLVPVPGVRIHLKL